MIICVRPGIYIYIYIYIYISKAGRSENRPSCTPFLFFYAIKPLSNLKSWWWREECCCFRLKSLYTYIFYLLPSTCLDVFGCIKEPYFDTWVLIRRINLITIFFFLVCNVFLFLHFVLLKNCQWSIK